MSPGKKHQREMGLSEGGPTRIGDHLHRFNGCFFQERSFGWVNSECGDGLETAKTRRLKYYLRAYSSK